MLMVPKMSEVTPKAKLGNYNFNKQNAIAISPMSRKNLSVEGQALMSQNIYNKAAERLKKLEEDQSDESSSD